MQDMMLGLLLAATAGTAIVLALIIHRVVLHRRLVAQAKRNLDRARHRRSGRRSVVLAPDVQLLRDGSLEVRRRNRTSERGDIEIFGAIALFVLIAIGYGIYVFAWNNTTATKTCTIQSKQATSQKEGGTNYLLFTKECGQLQVADSWIQGNFNSTDLYASIHEGNSYTVKTVGWRNGFFSTYPNVVEATP